MHIIPGLALGALLALGPAALALAQAPRTATGSQEFAEIAASSNLFEIETSKLAFERTTNDQVLAFAEQMVADHTAASDTLAAAAAADGVTLPAGMAGKEQTQLEQLRDARGETFDQVYLAAQVGAHDEAVELFATFAEQGEEGALRDFAAETLPTLQEHQRDVRELNEMIQESSNGG